MRRTFIAIVCTLAVAACAKPTSPELSERLQNPLYAEYYYEDLVEQLVQLQLSEDPSMKNDASKATADATRRDALIKANDAENMQNAGLIGTFVPGMAHTTGEALLTDDAVYFSPEFMTTPGVDVHVYLTETIDPIAVTFPDDSAREVGLLKSPYGDQAYTLSFSMDTARTVVLWDEGLDRVLGFAQLSSR